MEIPSFALAVVEDLSTEMDAATRFKRFVSALSAAMPGHACALLKREGTVLKPVAVRGLVAESMGRRFELAEHPRLATIMSYRGVTHFPHHSSLPDPYDGLLEGVELGNLHVHDCMGCHLHVNGRSWGAVTLDSLKPGVFDTRVERALAAFARFGEAVVHMAELGEQAQSKARMAAMGLGQAVLGDFLQGGAVAHGAREMIGDSQAMQALRQEIATVANSPLTVLVHGETGVGKELVAQALHLQSGRASHPFVAINCAALPDNLIESELFGHVKGAYSGAASDRMGKFELAHSGTLFLDEVGELSATAQSKLLRVLQSGQVQRVGSDKEHRVDVRVIAASNRDLAAEVKAGRFRADLFHRLCVYPLKVPTLRERGGDILQLGGYFLEQNRSSLGLRNLRLDPACEPLLLNYPWPGNVRELEHTISRAALRAHLNHGGDVVTIQPEHLDLAASGLPAAAAQLHTQSQVPTGNLRQAVDDYTAQLIKAALEQSQGNYSAAARQLGLDAGNFHRMCKRLLPPQPGRGSR